MECSTTHTSYHPANPFYQLREMLPLDKALEQELREHPIAGKRLFKVGKDLSEQLLKAGDYLAMLFEMRQAKKEILQGKVGQGMERYTKALDKRPEGKMKNAIVEIMRMTLLPGEEYDEALRSESVVFSKERLKASMSFFAQSLFQSVQTLEKHWSNQLYQEYLALTSNQENYEKLLAKQEARGVLPMHEDNPEILYGVVEDFLRIFEHAPEEKKQQLAISPLFAEESKFSKDSQLVYARPLNYILFTGHFRALEIIAPYLNEEDFLRLGPYESTFIHCLIAGLEKSVSKNGDPVACVKWLLEKFPQLKTKPNGLTATPEEYLYHVIYKIQGKIISLKREGPIDMLGSYRHIERRDCKGEVYTETLGDWQKIQSFAEELLKILSQ